MCITHAQHTHTHTCICMYTHTCALTSTHTYIHTHMHTYMHTHAHMHTHTYTHTYMYTHTCTLHTCTHTHMHTHIHAHTYMYTHIHAHTYMHTHMHVHTYMHIPQDDKTSMDFVVTAANLRAYSFHISQRSRFDIKCKSIRCEKPVVLTLLFPAMAGNIIPAIATTNAVIAGLIVMEALKILAGNFNKCRTVRSRGLEEGMGRRERGGTREIGACKGKIKGLVLCTLITDIPSEVSQSTETATGDQPSVPT